MSCFKIYVLHLVPLSFSQQYLKKLHLQERVIDEVKLAIKPFYSSKKINKEQYKLILRKAVPKVTLKMMCP